ncbi:hypothetical protein ACFSHQ_13460 [Gemmobacter lanyuensis]
MPKTALRSTAAAAVMPIAHSTVAALELPLLPKALKRFGKLYAESDRGRNVACCLHCGSPCCAACKRHRPWSQNPNCHPNP